MYPNLYYVFKDWFSVEWKALSFLNTFGLFVALAFLAAAIVLTLELKRKEKAGLLFPREEVIVIGKSAGFAELLLNAVIGFLFGYKLGGLFFQKPEQMPAQEYIFSGEGHIIAGIVVALLMAGMKWYEKDKQKLKEPEKRRVRIWPHDRVGDIIVLGLIFGILGAKLFDNFEHWDDFIKDPIGHIFSASGLTFYGGLILATIAISWFGVKKGIKLSHLADAVAPALMIAYAIGRIGCQVSGDGDWGILNSAYLSTAVAKTQLAKPGEFKQALENNATYYLSGKVIEKDSSITYVTDRTYTSLNTIPHRTVKAPSFLPVWLFAYTYPQNVNQDGNQIPGITDEHNRALPMPVFPTPLYEIILCTFAFFILWSIRKRIKTPLVLFGIYLVLNGFERFLVESIRVNRLYNFVGLQLSQAQIIAIALVVAGILLMGIAKKRSEVIEHSSNS